MNELRDMLGGSVRVQSQFLALRMREALPKMLEAVPAAKRDAIRKRFDAVAASGAGTFALIDYVNFKGEGTNPKERYKGEGWGMLQVLEAMEGNSAEDFGKAAAEVLERRVRNSPPERNEAKWLGGWKSRVKGY